MVPNGRNARPAAASADGGKCRRDRATLDAFARLSGGATHTIRRVTIQDVVRRCRESLAAHPLVGDALLAGTLIGFVVLVRLSEPLPANGFRAAALTGAMVAQGLPMLWRRSHPWLTFGAISAAYVGGDLLDTAVGISNNAPPVLAAYVVARYARTPGSAAVIAVLPVVVVTPELAAGPVRVRWIDVVIMLAIPVAVWLIGTYQRRILADALRLRELADRLRAEQQLSAERAVAAERVRIAHELHDLVAHHISAIAMLARVSADDPGRAGRSLAGIGTAADTALTEMRRLLRLLADSGPTEASPEPSLRYLRMLTDGLVAAGFRVKLAVDPSTEDIPGAVQVSAYRVVQEALTNAIRHAGPTDVVVDVTRDGGTLSVVVDNGPPSPGHVRVAGSGLGLVGMRERVALFDGTLDAGPRNGGWRVAASFRLDGSR
jgi:signal transduction histidine kinase